MTLYVAARVLVDAPSQDPVANRAIRRCSLKARESQKPGNLSGYYVDGRAGHETADSRRRDELHEPPEAKETNAQDDEAANERDRGGDLGAFPLVGMLLIHMLDDLRYCEGHDCDGPDGDIFRRGEELDGR